MTLLELDGLSVAYRTVRGEVTTVANVSLRLGRGQALGLVGESGCGKTTLALSLLRLLPANGRIVSGRVIYDGRDIVAMQERDLQRLRWKDIAIVFQGAMNALNPVRGIGSQIAEAITFHERVEFAEARRRTSRLFELVGLDPSRAGQFPHQFSGGMRQRAMIAMALACNPRLLIADEPTTALDVMIQAQILDLLRELRRELGLGLILITHDLSVVAEVADLVGLMYAGRLVELGPAEDVFARPQHPYARGLIQAVPSITGPQSLCDPIPGYPPDLLNRPPGCCFHPRCPERTAVCSEEEPRQREVGPGHVVTCHSAAVGRCWA